MYFIGIDVGTSSTKGVLIDQTGKVVSSKRYYHQIEHPHPGWAEQDPDKIWWDETVKIIAGLLQESGISSHRIAAVGCSGICPVVLPVDEQGRPLRKAILYSIDSRASLQIDQMTRQIGNDEIIRRSGQSLSPQSVLPKLRWLMENEPDVWRRTHRILGSSGYLVFKLCGAYTIDHFTASDGGYGYAKDQLMWDDSAFDKTNIPLDVMPELKWPSEIAGYVHEEAAKQTGLAKGTPVVVGTGDALSEMISTGIGEIGDTALLYGSTITTMTILDGPWYHPGFVTTPGWLPGMNITSAILGSGSKLLSWWSQMQGEEMNDNIFARFEQEAMSITPGAEGVTVFPYFTGQRSPQVDFAMKGTIIGLSYHHHNSHVVRAIMEGLGYALRLSLEYLPMISSIRAVGGAARSNLFLQIVSDICRMPQQLITESAGAPLGSAFLAGFGAGLLSKDAYREWVRTEKTVYPQPTVSQQYEKLYMKFITQLNAVRTLYHHD